MLLFLPPSFLLPFLLFFLHFLFLLLLPLWFSKEKCNYFNSAAHLLETTLFWVVAQAGHLEFQLVENIS